MIAIPAIVISYLAMKIPVYAKPVGVIFIIAFGTGIDFTAFGFVSPDQYMVATEVEQIEEVVEENNSRRTTVYNFNVGCRFRCTRCSRL